MLVVLDARQRDPDELRRVLHELSRTRAQVLGAVVNRARVGHRSYAAAYYAATNGNAAR